MSDTREDTTAPGALPGIAPFFDDIAAIRNDLFQSRPVLGYEQQVRGDAVLDRIRAQAGETILDVGCGNARDIIPMLQQGATIVGVDVSEGMIQQARQELAAAGYRDVRLEVGDATRLNFADASFDKIVCSEVLEHIPDAGRAVGEMHRVLKPGGAMVVSTPNRLSWYGFDRYVLWARVFRRVWNHPFDNWRSMRELCTLLERHGFQITSTNTVCYVPGFILTYALPRSLQRLIVSLVKKGDRLASRMAPRNGYLLVVTAVKNG
jgi:ubiquinone biosynthesis O-methyltransferase